MGLEQQLLEAAAGGACLSILDFSQVRVMDYSCADEVIAKLLMRYVSPERPVDAYFLARGLQEHHLEAVEAVLERHGLLLAAKDESRGEARLLGPCSEVERECWSVLVRRRRARQEELAEAIGLLDDALDALAHVRSLPETGGRAGVIGFCFGGTLAFRVAAAGDPDTAVSYYGSGIVHDLAEAERITCPILFHFGEDDPWIPQSEVDEIRAAFAGRSDAAVSVQRGAGHAFDNFTNPRFSNPEAAAAAWAQTASFLEATLPTHAEA